MLLLAAMIGCIVIAMRTPAALKKDLIREEINMILPSEEKNLVVEEEIRGL